MDWAEFGTWARDYVAVKGTEGEWVDLDELLKSLETFAAAASRPGPDDTVDEEHLRALADGIKAWRRAEDGRWELLWRALFSVATEPERWGRLTRALGPGLMAGAYEGGGRLRPDLEEHLQEIEAELASASGEARAKLERDRESLRDLLAAIDQTPEPSEAARQTWEKIKRLNEEQTARRRSRSER
jgi:hypothetical protein